MEQAYNIDMEESVNFEKKPDNLLLVTYRAKEFATPKDLANPKAAFATEVNGTFEIKANEDGSVVLKVKDVQGKFSIPE
jgi:hypothetical protein